MAEILQNETNKVLHTPEFLDLCSDALVKIVEQDVLNIPEREVWKAAVRWAKRRSNPDSGEALRQALEKPAKHIRVCTIDDGSLVKDVFTTRILTGDEVVMVCSSRSSGKKEERLVNFSNELGCRKRTCVLSFDYNIVIAYKSYHFFALTKRHAVELLPLKKTGYECTCSVAPKELTYDLKYTIKISRVTDCSNDTSTETPETITGSQVVALYDQEFTLPLTKDGKNIILEPNNKYKVEMEFGNYVDMYESFESRTWDDEHISVQPGLSKTGADICYCIPINTLHYRVAP